MPNTVVLQHENDCHCGKRAKFHVRKVTPLDMPDGVKGEHVECGNVCGVHVKKFEREGAETRKPLYICHDCGGHTIGGYVITFDLRHGGSVTKCMTCRDNERAAR